MTKDELIAKQQLEIEELNEENEKLTEACSDALQILWLPEQWNIKCPDFPKVAMKSILKAKQILKDVT